MRGNCVLILGSDKIRDGIAICRFDHKLEYGCSVLIELCRHSRLELEDMISVCGCIGNNIYERIHHCRH